MSGPYCNTCKYYAKYPIVKDSGECLDNTKKIYYSSGEAMNETINVSAKNNCLNYEFYKPKPPECKHENTARKHNWDKKTVTTVCFDCNQILLTEQYT